MIPLSAFVQQNGLCSKEQLMTVGAHLLLALAPLHREGRALGRWLCFDRILVDPGSLAV